MPAGTKGVVCLLFLACFATKIGVLPLQGGLPNGYGAAPRLGAASLSVALCAGFYGLWRFEFEVLGPLPVWCGDAFLILGAVTALAGITYALTQDSLRRFLGYSTVEHAGIVLVGLGVALLGQSAHKPILAAAGLLAATLQVIAHNLAKTLALITIDRVEQATGQRTLDPLGGLSRRLPASALALGISSLTLAAIPPLGGFVSEWFTFEALLQGFRMPTLLSRLLCALAAAALALTAGLGLLAFAKFYSAIFLGQARTKLAGVPRTNTLARRDPRPRRDRAVPGHGRAVGDPRARLRPADAARTQPGADHDQPPARAHARLHRLLGAGADMAEHRSARLRRAHADRRAADARPQRARTAGASRSSVGDRLRRRPGRRAIPAIGLFQPDACDPARSAGLPHPGPARAHRRPSSTPAWCSQSTDSCTCRRRDWPLQQPRSCARIQSGRLSVYLLYLLVALILALTLIPILR